MFPQTQDTFIEQHDVPNYRETIMLMFISRMCLRLEAMVHTTVKTEYGIWKHKLVKSYLK